MKGKMMQQTNVPSQMTNGLIRLVAVSLMIGGLISGCVSKEKFEQEKARALNFQRLLAQEEKRTGDLNTRVQEAKRQLSSLESQNRDLTIELEALRDQMARQTKSMADSMEQPRNSDMLSSDMTLSEKSLSEFGLSDLSFNESDFKDFDISAGTSSTYTVVRGDTLYRIAKNNGVTVTDLKNWNNLSGNIISVGQKLVVNRP
ncbi:MAG: LysM peptidoglycan-binding domain-containing protein [Nitrospirota bacterium]|nr:LysM peptidoglycan-binding domain-containing protein [Nitrospirota bacterium]